MSSGRLQDEIDRHAIQGDPRLDIDARRGRAGDPHHRRTQSPVPRFGRGSRVPGWDESVDLTKDPAVIPDPATTPVPAELRADIEAAMAQYPDRRSATIPALHAAQRLHGWCSPQAVEQVAAIMQLTPAYLISVATFYDMLFTEPKPSHDVFVCKNISCSLLGADELFEAMVQAAEGEDVHVQGFECLGACDIAPMASVNGEYIGPLNEEDAAQIVADLKAGRPVLEHKQLRYRRSADPGVEHHGQDFGPPPRDTPKAETAGLPFEGELIDRPGPTAPIEVRAEDESEEDQ